MSILKRISLSLCAFLLLVATVVAATATCVSSGVASAASLPSVSAKAAYVVDYSSGAEIYSHSENERLPIASMVKIMTSLLAFEAVESGKASLTDDVSVSAEAAGMGGSQVFLDAGSVHKYGDLLCSVIVASANDSCVALAEKIDGSVSAFVARMNERAKELGMQNTNFANCTGLPAAEGFSSAKDVSLMLRALLKHPKYYEYAGIWLQDYTHPDGRTTSMTNTNKLIRFYNGCDGGKTGFTGEAKFCLAATAQRNNMRIVAVVIGEESSKQRFADVSGVFNYAFANYSNKVLMSKNDDYADGITVLGGKQSKVRAGVQNDVCMFAKNGNDGGAEIKIEAYESAKAPVKAGDKVGTVYVLKDGVVQQEVPLIAKEDVLKSTYGDELKRIAENW